MPDTNSQKPLKNDEDTPVEPTTPEVSDTTEEGDSPEAAPLADISEPESEPSPEASAPDVTPVVPPVQQGKFKRFWAGYWAKKKWTLPLTFVAVVLVVLATPFTRYPLLGLALKKQVTIKVIDSTTHTPVSGASVQLAGRTYKTQGSGVVTAKVKVGRATLAVHKQYYKDQNRAALIDLSTSHNTFTFTLQATGRQVPLTVHNKITGKGVADVTIKVLGIEAKTDKDGKATVVVPTNSTGQKPQAIFQKEGFLTTTSPIEITDQNVAANTVTVTPAGKLYFLSNRSGNLDVVKSNLDGSARQVVLPGTGEEDTRGTSLLASRDWKYLALLSRREGDNPRVYLIDTTQNDKLTTIDEGEADFSLTGWSNDTFVYSVFRNNAPTTQGVNAIKSFNATTGKLVTLDQSVPQGSDTIRQTFGSPYIINDEVFFAKNWNTGFLGVTSLPSKSAELTSIKTDGSNKKTVRSFTMAAGVQTYSVSIDLKLYAPGELYVSFNDGNKTGFYEYENGQVKNADITQNDFYNKPYPTYLLSPSGKQTFWSELRDGKNTFFIGDTAGDNKKQIAALADYTPFGWYSDSYLLVAKQASELYIMPADGSQQPQKITDYYKPALNYAGYGGGYGGL